MVVQPNITWPTHLDLPDTDGLPVENDIQFYQARLLSSAVEPFLWKLHPAGDYYVGSDVGIYWRATDPPLNGCKSPDWYYVPGCRKMPDGQYRRSYVMWDEGVSPLIVMEFVSGDGSEEHDDEPGSGKFWVYRRGIRAGYYAIHDPARKSLELYKTVGGDYRPVQPNEHGLFVIEPLGLALGHWEGTYGPHTQTWVRFYTPDGTLVPSEREVIEVEHRRAETLAARAEAEKARADGEKARADKTAADMAELLAKLQAKGIDPNTL
jgi:Uma2 family endonuclease